MIKDNNEELDENCEKIIKDWCEDLGYTGPLAYYFDHEAKVLNIYFNRSIISIFGYDDSYCYKLEALFSDICGLYIEVKVYDLGTTGGFIYNNGTDIIPYRPTTKYTDEQFEEYNSDFDYMRDCAHNLTIKNLYENIMEWCKECDYQKPIGFSLRDVSFGFSVLTVYAEDPSVLINNANRLTNNIRKSFKDNRIEVSVVELANGGFIK